MKTSKMNLKRLSSNAFLKRPESIALILCAFMFIFLGVSSPYFFNSYNLDSIITQISPEGIVSLGMMMLLITGVFDLSVGSVMCLGGLVAAIALNFGIPAPVAILLGLGSGALIGMLNGIIVEIGRVNPLITTIGMMYIVRGITELTLVSRGKEGYTNFPDSFTQLGKNVFPGVPWMLLIFLILIVVFSILISRTRLGRRMYFIGGNEQAAVAMGINKKKIRITLFIIVGILAALAGILLDARSGSANRYIGQRSHMNIIIACIIGGGSLAGGRGNMLGAVLGILFLTLLNNSFNLFDVNQYIQSLVQGIVLLLVVVLDGYINIRKRKELGRE